MGVDGTLTASSIPFPWNLIPVTVLLAPGILPSQTWDPGGDKSISSPSLLPTFHPLHAGSLCLPCWNITAPRVILIQPSSIHPFWVLSILSGGGESQKAETNGSSPSGSYGEFVSSNIQSCLPGTSCKSGVRPQKCKMALALLSQDISSSEETRQPTDGHPRACKSQQHGELRRHALCSWSE